MLYDEEFSCPQVNCIINSDNSYIGNENENSDCLVDCPFADCAINEINGEIIKINNFEHHIDDSLPQLIISEADFDFDYENRTGDVSFFVFTLVKGLRLGIVLLNLATTKL